MQLRRLLVDVLIPHEPDIFVFAEGLCKLDKVDGVTIHVAEVDDKTKTVEITIEGEDLSFDAISQTIEDIGGSIHSIDEVAVGSRIILRK